MDRRMPLGAGELLTARSGSRPQRHAVVELHVVADFAGLTDHRAGAVIDEKMMANLRAGMQIHAGTFVGPLGHNARQ